MKQAANTIFERPRCTKSGHLSRCEHFKTVYAVPEINYPSDLTDAAIIIALIREEQMAENFHRNRKIHNSLSWFSSVSSKNLVTVSFRINCN